MVTVTTTRPQLPQDVPLLTKDGRCYVRECDIPEPARSRLLETMRLAQIPVIKDEPGPCYYSHDWALFLERWLRSH